MTAPSGIGHAMIHMHGKYGIQGATRPDDRPVVISVSRACGRCHGLGYIIIGEDYQGCPVCKGEGIR